MTTYKLVMPGDMNHYGFLFGGKMLMWVDEVACVDANGAKTPIAAAGDDRR